MKIKRPIIDNAIYFITTSTVNKRKILKDYKNAKIVADQFIDYEKLYRFTIYTYAVMPNHYHLLLKVGPKKNISQILHGINSYTSYLINKKNFPKVQVWDRRPHDEVIRSNNMFWQKFAYILLNPCGGE